MSDLRKQAWDSMQKHPGHDDQSVHDPKGGKGKGKERPDFVRGGNTSWMDRIKDKLNAITGKPHALEQEWSKADRAGREKMLRRGDVVMGHSLRDMEDADGPERLDENMAYATQQGAPPAKDSTPTILWHGTAKEHMDLVLKNGLQTAKVLGIKEAGWGYDADADGEADPAKYNSSESRSAVDGDVAEARAQEEKVAEMKEWVRMNPDLAQSRANSVYLAKEESTAEKYAYDTAQRAGSDQVAMLQITIPADVEVQDDEFWKGAYRLESNIPPSWITGYKSGTVHPNGIAWTNLMETSASALKMLAKAAMDGKKIVYVPVVFKK